MIGFGIMPSYWADDLMGIHCSAVSNHALSLEERNPNL